MQCVLRYYNNVTTYCKTNRKEDCNYMAEIRIVKAWCFVRMPQMGLFFVEAHADDAAMNHGLWPTESIERAIHRQIDRFHAPDILLGS